jgi:CubicO group peptidase (beta-lactamase class C family)
LGATPAANLDTGWLGEITLEQLATHTAGFAEPTRYSALEARPGTKWIYSNTGTNWLANVLTHVYRQDLRQLTETRLFAPLELIVAQFVGA